MSQDIANQLFLAYLGRPADVAWRSSTATLLNGAAPSVALQNAFYTAAVLDGSFSLTDSASTLVNKIFLNLGLNNGAGATTFEQTEWAKLISAGTITAATASWTIFTSYLGATNVPDSYKIPAQSKLIALNAYTTELSNNATANLAISQLGSSASGSARAVISGVLTQANAAAAVTGIATTVNQIAVPVTTGFTLTTGADTLTGTSGPDTFYATAGAASATLNSTDTINGGAGTDILEVTATAAIGVGAFPGASVSNVEILNVRTTTFGVNVDASLFPGLTQVNSVQGTGTLGITNLATGASIGIVGNGSTSIGAVTYAYATATDAQVVNVSGGTLGANVTSSNGTGTTVTVNSTTAANTLGTLKFNSTAANKVTSFTINASTDLTATLTKTDFAATAALTVTGAGKVDVSGGAVVPTFKTIDASASSGGLSVNLDTAITSFKGSSGNDTVTVATALGTSTAGAIDAGAGTGDVLFLSASKVASSTLGAAYTGFEILRVSATAATSHDLSFVSGITALEIAASAGPLTFTNMSATQAASITVKGNQSGAAGTTFTLANAAGTSDVANISFEKAATTHTAFTVTGFETVNLTAAAATTIANITSTDTTALTLKGAGYTFTSLAGITKGVTIDASALTGGLTISAGLAGSGGTTTGTGFADNITLGAGFNTYNLGAGNDTVSGALTAFRNGTSYNAIDGGAGTDTVTITGNPTALVDDDFRYITNVENIGISNAAAINLSITSGGFFDNNFKASGVTLTTTTLTTGTQTIALGSFSGTANIVANAAAAINITGAAGASKIDATATGASAITITTGNGNQTVNANSGSGQIQVTTGSGDDTITITGGAATNTVIAGGGNDTITGSGLVDTITGGTGQDKMTGGAGADIFVFSGAAGANTSGITIGDEITDFLIGTDKLQFTGVTDVVSVQQNAVQAAVTALGSSATAAQIATAMATANTTNLGVSFAVLGGNTYVYFETTGSGTGVAADDVFIKLTGVTTLPTFAGDVTP